MGSNDNLANKHLSVTFATDASVEAALHLFGGHRHETQEVVTACTTLVAGGCIGHVGSGRAYALTALGTSRGFA